jgi:hypothetical protein
MAAILLAVGLSGRRPPADQEVKAETGEIGA